MADNNTNIQQLLENSKEDFSSIVTINNTSYNIYEHWLKLAAKYFNIDTSTNYDINNQDNLNLLKAGLFGYFNEISSHEIKNAVFHRNVLYDEHFLNSASFPESIFNFAKLYNVPISTAHPAHMLVELIIKKDDLLNTSLKKEIISDQVIDINTLKTYQLTISKNYEFAVDKFKYLLPYDVEILIKQTSNKDYTITASYNMEDSNFPYYEEINSPYIKVYQDIINSESYVFFALDIYQMESSTTDFTILSEDISDNLFYTAEFPNQLAYFNVYYTYQGEKYLLNQYFNNTYTPSDSEEKYCYYTFLDDDKIQISFSSLPNSFRPRYNSQLSIECLTTLGSEGNFTYKDEILFSFSSDSSTNFEKIPVTVVPITDSSNGTDKLNNTGMKQRIIQEALTRDNLITDPDLEIYFTNVNNNNNVNGSYIKFIKKQDDFLKRIYNSFLLMREKSEKVIPTNTAKYIILDKSEGIICNNNNSYVFPEYSLVKCEYNNDSNNFYYEGNELNEEKRLEIISNNKNLKNGENNVMYYLNPFLIKIDIDPVLKASYYSLDINNTFDLNYSYLNNLIPVSLLINKLSIKKENNFQQVDNETGEIYHILEREIDSENSYTLSSDTYCIYFDLNSNESISEVDKKIKIRGVILSESTGQKYGYFEFKRKIDMDENSNATDSRYEARISTDRTFDKGQLILKNSLYDRNGLEINQVPIEENLIIKIGVLFKDPELALYNGDIAEFNELFNDSFPNEGQENGSDETINDYTLALTVETNESVNLYKNLSNVMSSIVTKTNEDGTEKVDDINEAYLKTELIPLVDTEYFLYNNDEVYNIINNYIKIIENCIPRLENNTTIDLKFYNTYGPSNHYYIDTAVGEQDDIKFISLGRVDILFDFNIHLYEYINEEVDNSIKKFISDFIEACNEEGIVPISNLIRLLETNFPVIKYIEYNGLSGEYYESLSNKYQKIEDKDQNFLEMTKQEIIEYVPEYVNLKKGLKNYSVVNEDDSSTVNLGKKYDYIINITYN